MSWSDMLSDSTELSVIHEQSQVWYSPQNAINGVSMKEQALGVHALHV